jgi:hypothetical protein
MRGSIIRKLWQTRHRAVDMAGRLHRLLSLAAYLTIQSKLSKAPRIGSTVERTLLATKSVSCLPPQLVVHDRNAALESWSRGFGAANAALFANLCNPDALSTVRYARPAPSFRAIYLWDSAFIAQIWKQWDPAVARDILNSVVDGRRGDRLQHFVSDLASSRFTQPPLIAWSFGQLESVVTGERFLSWTKFIYEPLRAYHRWLYANRRLPNGLFAWAHPYESGVENAPRFGSRDERRMIDTQRIGAPDFCAYMVLQCEALAALACNLRRADEAGEHQQQASALRSAVNAQLWDETEGLYFDRDSESGEFIRSRTIASLLPLWAGIPDVSRAERLRGHIMDREAFNTPIPLPSVARNDPSFEKDMWRGPVWVNVAFAVIAGLMRYGYHEDAADLTFRLCDGVYRTFHATGRFYEFYDPEGHGIEQLHRKRGNLWKRLTLGPRPVSEFVGWSGLVNTLVVETLFGFRRVPGGVIIQPRFPSHAEGLNFHLSLPGDKLEIVLDVRARGEVAGQCQTGGRCISFEAIFGEAVELPSGGTERGRHEVLRHHDRVQ